MPSEDTTRKKDESRRDFLKTSAAVGGAVATTFTAANAVHAQGSDILKIGLIGCGGRGTGAAVNAMRACNAGIMCTRSQTICHTRYALYNSCIHFTKSARVRGSALQ